MKVTVKIARLSSGRFRAWCPALPGCVVLGLTQKEALSKISDAARGYLASMDVALPRELSRLVSVA